MDFELKYSRGGPQAIQAEDDDAAVLFYIKKIFNQKKHKKP